MAQEGKGKQKKTVQNRPLWPQNGETDRKKGTRKRDEHFRRSLREGEHSRGKRTQETRDRKARSQGS